MISAYHGLKAYSRDGLFSTVKKARSFYSDLPDHAEICVADRPIGPFGVKVEGDCKVAFNGDCFSIIDYDGKRTATRDYVESFYRESGISDSEWRSFCKSEKAGEKHYCEAWLSQPIVVGVWVKAWASEDHKKAARCVAAKYNVAVYYVDNNERVFNDIDSPLHPDYWEIAAGIKTLGKKHPDYKYCSQDLLDNIQKHNEIIL